MLAINYFAVFSPAVDTGLFGEELVTLGSVCWEFVHSRVSMLCNLASRMHPACLFSLGRIRCVCRFSLFHVFWSQLFWGAFVVLSWIAGSEVAEDYERVNCVVSDEALLTLVPGHASHLTISHSCHSATWPAPELPFPFPFYFLEMPSSSAFPCSPLTESDRSSLAFVAAQAPPAYILAEAPLLYTVLPRLWLGLGGALVWIIPAFGGGASRWGDVS